MGGDTVVTVGFRWSRVVMGGNGVVMVGFGCLRVVAKCCKASIIKESPSSAQVAQIGEKNFKKRNEENQFFL